MSYFWKKIVKKVSPHFLSKQMSNNKRCIRDILLSSRIKNYVFNIFLFDVNLLENSV